MNIWAAEAGSAAVVGRQLAGAAGQAAVSTRSQAVIGRHLTGAARQAAVSSRSQDVRCTCKAEIYLI